MTSQIKDQIRSFFEHYPQFVYKKGDTILLAGEKSSHFFFLESGAVRMTTTSPRGQALTLHIFYPGACFSLLDIVSEGKTQYDFRAITTTTVRKVPQQALRTYFSANADVVFEFLLRMMQGMKGLLSRIEQISFNPAYNRVAGLLVYFERHFSEKVSHGQHGISIHVTHQEIADWLGLSRENVSMQMKHLEKAKLVSKKGRLIEVLDLEALKKLADPYAPDSLAI